MGQIWLSTELKSKHLIRLCPGPTLTSTLSFMEQKGVVRTSKIISLDTLKDICFMIYDICWIYADIFIRIFF